MSDYGDVLPCYFISAPDEDWQAEDLNPLERDLYTYSHNVIPSLANTHWLCKDCGRIETIRYLNAYRERQAYGGPEEGGWYYQVGEPMASVPVFSPREASELTNQWAETFPANFGTPRYTRFVFSVEEDMARAYPDKRPHYE